MGVFLVLGLYLVILPGILASDDSGRELQCGLEASPHPLHHDPWVVFLEFYRRGQLTELRCAGTLISALYVLTAAHCVGTIKYNLLQARLGEYDVSSDLECIEGVCADPLVRIPVDEVTVHPDFDGRESDIALLRLAEDAPYTDFIRPICLPTGYFKTTTTFHAAGWGEIVGTSRYSDVKKSIPLPYKSYDICTQAFTHDKLPKHSICAGGVKGIDTCRGDSGGPLMRTADRIEIWGITSLGTTVCGRKDKPGIYTSVVYYLPWIKYVTNLT